MVGKQLELDVCQHGRGALAGFGNHERLVGDLGRIRETIGDGDHWRAAGLDLFYIPERFPGAFVVSGDDREDGGLGGHQRERAVFEFARGEAFGVFVADLLAFQRALQSDRDVGPAADEKVSVAADVLADQLFGPRAVENRLDVIRQITERLDQRPEVARSVDQLFGQQVAAHQLRRKGLRCGDPILRLLW